MKWRLHWLKLPYERNNPNNPQKTKKKALLILRPKASPFVLGNRNAKPVHSEKNHNIRATSRCSFAPWASAITHKLPLKHIFIIPQRSISSHSRARLLAQPAQKLIMIISDDTLSDAKKGFSVRLAVVFSLNPLFTASDEAATNNQFLVFASSPGSFGDEHKCCRCCSYL